MAKSKELDKKALKAAEKEAKAKAKAKAEKAKAKEEKKSKKSKKEKVKSAPKRKVTTITPITEKFTRKTLLEHIAVTSGIEVKDVRKVYVAIENTILGSIGKKGRGEFIWPTLLKIVTKEKPATKARKGISPFTGEETIFKAKPKTTVVKARPLGKIKKAAKGEL